MMRLLKGGRVVDPANGRDGIFDILIDGDRIARVGVDLQGDESGVDSTCENAPPVNHSPGCPVRVSHVARLH